MQAGERGACSEQLDFSPTSRAEGSLLCLKFLAVVSTYKKCWVFAFILSSSVSSLSF